MLLYLQVVPSPKMTATVVVTLLMKQMKYIVECSVALCPSVKLSLSLSSFFRRWGHGVTALCASLMSHPHVALGDAMIHVSVDET